MPKINIDYDQFTEDQIQMIDCIIEWFKNEPKQYLRIGGAAGTGKTTVIANIATIMKNKINFYPRVAYCAFTGKAAKVMIDKGLDASTIHSLIYVPKVKFDEETGFLKHEYTLKESIDYDLIVVDEASTVSEELHRDMMSFGVKILYVGDYAQLPPVGNDINLMEENSLDFKLTQIHRQAENSGIIKLSMAVRNGDNIAFHKSVDTMKIKVSEFEDKNFLQYNQILCGKNAVRVMLNQRIRKLYDFCGECPQRKDKMMFLMNNKDLGTYNGQQFIVTSSYKTKDGNFIIKFIDIYNKEIGEQSCLLFGKIINSEHGISGLKMTKKEWKKGICFADLSYAVTVHKCVTGDTIIDTEENGNIEIKNYNGEKVNNGNEYVKPLKFFHYYDCECLKLVTKNNKTLTATFNHNQPTCNRGIVEFCNLKIGDVVDTIDGRSEIASIEYAGVNDVYCFEMPNVHTFIQNGILSGNSQGSEWPSVILYDDNFGYWDYSLRQRFLYTAITRASKTFVWLVP